MKTLKNYLVITVLAVMQMLVVSSVFAQTEVEGVIMKSFYTPTKDLPGSNVTGQHGYLTLETYVTGEQVTTHTVKTKACDIVLVLDQSGSMKNSITSYTYSARSSQGYSYNDYGGWNTYYYKDGDEYYEVTRGRTWNSPKYYYLQYTKNGQPIYLSGTSTTTTQPTNVTSQSTTIWTGILYSRSSSSTTKAQALKDAVNAFISQVQTNAKENSVNHRIAIVGFASTGSNSTDYTNTELLSTSSEINYRSASNTNYKDALVVANNNGSINTRLTTAVNRLSTSGDTYSEYGIDMANKIFAQYNTADDKERQRVVVMFTDGYTAPRGTDDIDYSMSDRAITNAKISKTTYNAKVYTIGILDNANPNSDFNTNFNYGSTNSDRQLVAANRYMHYVSSEYPYAVDLKSKLDTLTKGSSGCYMIATDASQLKAIFTKIAVDDITGGASNTTVTETTVAKGVLSPYFKLPDNVSLSDIKVFVALCTGEVNNPGDDYDTLTFGNVLTPSTQSFALAPAFDKATKQVTCTGFNYSENWCGTSTEQTENMVRKAIETYRGYKLIMVFPVEIDNAGLNELWKNPDKVLDDLTRGKVLPINTEASGLYGENGEIIAPYQTHEYYTTSPLPVELLSFSANCMDQSVQLTWSTASETNNEYFTIERSEDAVHYMEVARVQGAGTSAFQNDYSFMLDNTTNHTMYYRLRQTDIDGTTEVFEPIAVQCNVEATEVAMYPVPAKNNVTLQSNVEMQMVHIYNVYGALVNRMEVNANNTVIDLSSIAAGIYTVKITMANGEQVSRKLIKR